MPRLWSLCRISEADSSPESSDAYARDTAADNVSREKPDESERLELRAKEKAERGGGIVDDFYREDKVTVAKIEYSGEEKTEERYLINCDATFDTASLPTSIGNSASSSSSESPYSSSSSSPSSSYYPRDEPYNLAVDASMWIAPCLARCQTSRQFVRSFDREFRARVKRFRGLFADAREIVVAADRAVPPMKRETLEDRRRRRSVFCSNDCTGVVVVAAAADANAAATRFLPPTPSKSALPSSRNRVSSSPSAPSSSFGCWTNNYLTMNHVRRFVRILVNEALRDLAGVNANRVFHQYDNNGEGENKCFEFPFADNSIARVVLTNDSDAILLQLSRSPPSLDLCGRGGGGCDGRAIVFLAKEANRCEDRSVTTTTLTTIDCDWPAFFDKDARWLATVWLLVCFGNDYVEPLVMMGNGEGGKGTGGNASMTTFDWKRERLYENLARLRGTKVDFPLTRANFITAVASWTYFEQKSGTKSTATAQYADEEHERWKVLCWLRRLYWSVLYARDTPVDYNVESTFRSDPTVRVNAHIQKCCVTSRAVARFLFDVTDEFEQTNLEEV